MFRREPLTPVLLEGRLSRRAFVVQVANASSLGLPATGRARSMTDAQSGRQSTAAPSALLPRSINFGLVPPNLTTRILPAQAKRIVNKRVRAKRRQQKFEDRLRAAHGDMGVLHRLLMGKSEADYRRRVDML